MGWIVYFAVFGSMLALGSKLLVRERRFENRARLINGVLTIAILLTAGLVSMWVTQELGFDIGGRSAADYDRPAVGPFEW